MAARSRRRLTTTGAGATSRLLPSSTGTGICGEGGDESRTLESSATTRRLTVFTVESMQLRVNGRVKTVYHECQNPTDQLLIKKLNKNIWWMPPTPKAPLEKR